MRLFLFCILILQSTYSYNNKFSIQKKMLLKRNNLIIQKKIYQNTIYKNLLEEKNIQIIRNILLTNKILTNKKFNKLNYDKSNLKKFLNEMINNNSKLILITNINKICINNAKIDNKILNCEDVYYKNIKKFIKSNKKILNDIKNDNVIKQKHYKYFFQNKKNTIIKDSIKEKEKYIKTNWSRDEKKRLYAPPYIKMYLN